MVIHTSDFDYSEGPMPQGDAILPPLVADQAYEVSVRLTVPQSNSNFALGAIVTPLLACACACTQTTLTCFRRQFHDILNHRHLIEQNAHLILDSLSPPRTTRTIILATIPPASLILAPTTAHDPPSNPLKYLHPTYLIPLARHTSNWQDGRLVTAYPRSTST